MREERPRIDAGDVAKLGEVLEEAHRTDVLQMKGKQRARLARASPARGLHATLLGEQADPARRLALEVRPGLTSHPARDEHLCPRIDEVAHQLPVRLSA